jgi:hypothetical protein
MPSTYMGVQLRPWPPSLTKNSAASLVGLPVRSQSASRKWRKEINAYAHVLEELILNCLLIQSAVSPFLSGAWLRIADSIFPAATIRSRLTACV